MSGLEEKKTIKFEGINKETWDYKNKIYRRG